MVHPLFFVGLLLAKKAVAVSLYTAGSRYGWPRVYRRLLEASARVTPPGRRPAVARALALTLRAPARGLEALRNSEVGAVLTRAAEDLRRQGGVTGVAAAALIRRALADGGAALTELTHMAEEKRSRKGGLR